VVYPGPLHRFAKNHVSSTTPTGMNIEEHESNRSTRAPREIDGRRWKGTRARDIA